MAKGRITIDETFCKGCAYCAYHCPRECLVISKGRVSPKGYLLPEIINPDDCTACGVCAWMCPEFAIDVFKYKEN